MPKPLKIALIVILGGFFFLTSVILGGVAVYFLIPKPPSVVAVAPFVSTDGHFQVVLPSGFPALKKTVAPPSAEKNYNTISYTSSPDNDTSLLINITDYQELRDIPPQDLLTEGLQAISNSLKATLSTPTLTDAHGMSYQTAYFSPAPDGQYYGRADLYLDVANKRLFQMLYLTKSPMDPKSEKITNAFSSFTPQG